MIRDPYRPKAICQECVDKHGIREPPQGMLGLAIWGCSLCKRQYGKGGRFHIVSKLFLNRTKTFISSQKIGDERGGI